MRASAANTLRCLARCAAAAALLVLAACGGLATRDSESLRAFSANSAITEWQLRGRIGLKSSERASSGYLNWWQCGDRYEIRINGPLGAGAARLVGDSHGVALYENNQPPRTATDAATLLREHLGWELPVADLSYWIRGLPSTDSRYRSTGAGFRQAGWELSFPRQTHIKSFDLPAKAIARHADAVVTLVFQEWQLDVDCGALP